MKQKKKKNEKHEFAFFTSEVAHLIQSEQEYRLKDIDLNRRLLSIVRVHPGEKIILFDTMNAIVCTVISYNKKETTIITGKRTTHMALKPEIIWLLPLLEREAFEDSLEALMVMGATTIIPLITQKSRKVWGVGSSAEKEHDRARRLMIAAAEQSKQFMLPVIQKTVDITIALNNTKNHTTKIFFDTTGKPAFEILEFIRNNKPQSIIALVGPEGDLTTAEKKLVQQHNFEFCKLTPTILRARTAVELGIGLLRSCIT